MKYCTVRQDGEFYSCDTVDDGHRFGTSADGKFRHVEGVALPDDRIVAFGMVRGNMADLYPVLTPCGHGAQVNGTA